MNQGKIAGKIDLNIRCSTAIPGLDEFIEGGFPRRRSILLSGTCGSGKTTMALQFPYNGIVKYNEPGWTAPFYMAAFNS